VFPHPFSDSELRNSGKLVQNVSVMFTGTVVPSSSIKTTAHLGVEKLLGILPTDTYSEGRGIASAEFPAFPA